MQLHIQIQITALEENSKTKAAHSVVTRTPMSRFGKPAVATSDQLEDLPV